MPELPEVETVKNGLEKALLGKTVAAVELRRKNLRAPFPQHFAKTLAGRTLANFSRRAKYILIGLSGGYVWLVHLGMSGSFRLLASVASFIPEKHDHVVVAFTDGTGLVYNDPRRFGQMDVFASTAAAKHPALSALGPEPLEEDFTPALLVQRLSGKKTAIKLALLDQCVVAGVGNIYACEALYRAGINPLVPASSVKGAKAAKLVRAIKSVMHEALASGGSTLRDHRQLDGNTGYFQHSFDVYGHEGKPCGHCTCGKKTAVKAITQSGRTTFYCPHRQK